MKIDEQRTYQVVLWHGRELEIGLDVSISWFSTFLGSTIDQLKTGTV
jgi:hypothetical protein